MLIIAIVVPILSVRGDFILVRMPKSKQSEIPALGSEYSLAKSHCKTNART